MTRGTTQRIEFIFPVEIDVSNVSSVTVTFEQEGYDVVIKNTEDCIIDYGSRRIITTLNVEETERFKPYIPAHCDISITTTQGETTKSRKYTILIS